MVADGVKRVVIAVGPRKDTQLQFHALIAPCRINFGNSYFITFRRGEFPAAAADLGGTLIP